jgi:S-DNA-T family DNA segregation ATPase FtsK/SpoIIIE
MPAREPEAQDVLSIAKPDAAPRGRRRAPRPAPPGPPARAPAPATRVEEPPPASHRAGEFLGLILMALSLLTTAALVSLQFGSGKLMGPFGRMLALSLYALVGLGGYLLVLALAFIGLRFLLGRGGTPRLTIWLGYVGATITGAILFHCLFPRYLVYGFGAGGKGGEILGEVFIALFSTAGTYLVTTVGMVLCLLLATEASLVGIAISIAQTLAAMGRAISRTLVRVGSALRSLFSWQVTAPAAASDGTLTLPAPREIEMVADEPPLPELGPVAKPTPAAAAVPVEAAPPSDTAPTPAPAPASEPEAGPEAGPEAVIEPEKPWKPRAGKPKIVESEFQSRKTPPPLGTVVPLTSEGMRLPELSMLDTPPPDNREIDRDAMQKTAERLARALKTYQIPGDITEIHPGPVITQYELRPAPGIKVSKIDSLDRDLAMSLAAEAVRIEAPIPGKGTVGIEVPNKKREMVYLQEVLVDPVFTQAKSLLTLCLGKDISGRPSVCDLAKAPHLLVAGSTGTGKSVGINAMLMSLLFRATPDQVRLILIDPKMVEFSSYEGIPHLLLPVVTDPRHANQALRWAVAEMERRYQLLFEANVRNLAEYNLAVAEKQRLVDEVVRAGPDPDAVPVDPASEEASDAAVRAFEARRALEPLPLIVIVIDEFADLMMVAAKDVETSVARIAQKARAAGIHLILATQRPSKDVITGLIKGNFPTRVSFQVASKIDSRVVLDRNGAEALLGKGDMLFMNAGQSPTRLHGAYVSTEEVNRVVAFLKSQAKPSYNLDILKPDDEEGGEGGDDGGGDGASDELYDRAVVLVTSARRASTSWVQRELRIGYNSAARLIERMEREGVVGPQLSGARNREVLAPPPPPR